MAGLGSQEAVTRRYDSKYGQGITERTVRLSDATDDARDRGGPSLAQRFNKLPKKDTLGGTASVDTNLPGDDKVRTGRKSKASKTLLGSSPLGGRS